MSVYTLVLFAHILGVLGLFIGVGLEWATLLRLRQAQTMNQVRERIGLIGVQERLPQIGLLLILLAGIYMTATRWGWTTPWILVSLAVFVVIGALGGGLIDRRLGAIRRAALDEGSAESIPLALQAQIVDPVLWTALQVAAMLALGVVFLMTNKPDLLVSLIALVVAIGLGVVFARPWRRPREAKDPMRGATPGA
jgi:hypothetical protein